METAKETKRIAQGDGVRRHGRPAAQPRVRRKCGICRRLSEEVLKQLRAEHTAIVTATIDKAKAGSLVHTKWLWGVADKNAAKDEAVKVSLAEVLMRELERLETALEAAPAAGAGKSEQ